MPEVSRKAYQFGTKPGNIKTMPLLWISFLTGEKTDRSTSVFNGGMGGVGMRSEKEIILKFLDSRKSKATQSATIGIIRYLNHARQTHEGGWVRAGELQGFFVRQGHLSDSTLFRLLADMERAGLITKDASRIEYGERSLHNKKKPSVYYRTEAEWDISRWVKYAAVIKEPTYCYAKYDIALKMLKEAGIENPKEEIEKRFEKDWGVSE